EAEYRRALDLQAQLAADFPTVPEYAVELGGSYGNFGALLCQRGEAAASLNWYAKGLATLRPVLAQETRVVTARACLRTAHWHRALALGQLGRHAEAVADWEHARALNDERQYDSWFRLRRASSLVRAGQPAEATVAMEDILKPGNAAIGTL